MLESGAGRVAARGGVSGASGGLGAHRQLGLSALSGQYSQREGAGHTGGL